MDLRLYVIKSPVLNNPVVRNVIKNEIFLLILILLYNKIIIKLKLIEIQKESFIIFIKKYNSLYDRNLFSILKFLRRNLF